MMTTMGAGSALRLTHTAVLAAVCVIVSGLGHDLSSGAAPSPQGYALALPPVCAIAWRLTRRRRSAPAVVTASALLQLALHVLFGLAPHGASPGPAHGGHPAMREAPLTGLLAPALLTSLTYGMAGAHVLAGAVCGWWLWRGEHALVQLARALALFLGGRLRFALTVLTGAYSGLPVFWAPVGRRAPALLPASLEPLRALYRRGPPLLPS
ncbi:hypothetical protein [Streptomyces jumonjinensis]|nr:hypothetical protein [Streptomyces jumonjinensis]